jgi:hypothetical protein
MGKIALRIDFIGFDKKSKITKKAGSTKPSRSKNLGSGPPESQKHIGGPKGRSRKSAKLMGTKDFQACLKYL